MKRIHHAYILLALLWSATLVSCIREDQSDCPAGLKICFTYSPATYARTGVNPNEVERIDLYIFDAAGIFRGVWTDEHPVLSPGYSMTLPVFPKGDYRFIAWGSMHECYSVTPEDFTIGQTTYSEMQLRLDNSYSTASTGIHPLFHAEKTDHIQNATRLQQVDLSLVQAYNTINLTTEGFPSTEDDFRLSVTDNNGRYNFDYSFAACSEFTYTTPCLKNTGGQLQASLNVLKLAAGRHPRLEIYNVTGQKVLYSADLIALLNAIGDMDYEQIHTFDIHIKFTTNDTDLSATVTINGWQVSQEEEILY